MYEQQYFVLLNLKSRTVKQKKKVYSAGSYLQSIFIHIVGIDGTNILKIRASCSRNIYSRRGWEYVLEITVRYAGSRF